MRISRRRFNRGLTSMVAGGPLVGALGRAGGLGASQALAQTQRYGGPNVVLVRFGGGVRRSETIQPKSSFAPYLMNVLAPRGVLIPDLTLAEMKGVDTSHAEGTLNLLTGRYKAYSKIGSRGLAPLLEPNQPTLFEYARKSFGFEAHECLLVNGEDRPQEEYLTYGGHRHYGVSYRSEVIGLYRFKLHRLRRMLDEGRAPEIELVKARKALAKLLAADYRGTAQDMAPKLQRFWDRWRAHYGDSGVKHPRGDRLLTELALWALRELKPRLMMINYQDPDYVHWGNASHYTRAIAVIDQGLRALASAIETEPFYRANTVLVIVPDCGRDANALMSVPFQHHFNSRSAHEIFALVSGPGIARGRVLDKPVDQTSIAATVGAIMGFRVEAAEGRVLSEILT